MRCRPWRSFEVAPDHFDSSAKNHAAPKQAVKSKASAAQPAVSLAAHRANGATVAQADHKRKLLRSAHPVCKAGGQKFRVTDPGRAMISGKCADIGKTKGPILRGLAARAPYFHNGSAASLLDVVNFYDRRFNLGLAEKQEADLAAFLGSL